MGFDKTLPYNDLPSLPPTAELDTKAILKQTIAAGRALAELKGSGDLIPNQSLLIHIVGLQEAKLSSEIENIVTTNDDLYRAFSDREIEAADPNTREVLHYSEALWYGYAALKSGRPLSTRLFEEIVQHIKNNTGGIRKGSGTRIEDGQNNVVYTPPDGESFIRDKLANIENFIHNDDDIDPLIKMAILHYQFEAIHPFTDGNGRTGRILNILYLVSAGLIDIPILYLSRYIIENKAEYYLGLRAVTEEGNWENWILYMLKAVEETSLNTHKQIMEIRLLMQTIGEKIQAELPKIYRKELVELLFAQTYVTIKSLEQAGMGNRQTASKYLQELDRIGVLKRVNAGREAYFINVDFFALLTR